MNNGNLGSSGVSLPPVPSLGGAPVAVLDGAPLDHFGPSDARPATPAKRSSLTSDVPTLQGAKPGAPLRSRDALTDAAPITGAQRRWWLLEQLEPGRAIPCVGFRLGLRGALEVDALEAALSAVVDRHEVLRCAFSVIAGQPMQAPVQKAPLRLARTDLGAIDREKQARILERLAREDAEAAFDLAEDVLMRARLVRLADDEHVLQIVVHPLAGDRGSIPVLCRDLGDFYQAFSAGTVPLLPDLPLRYTDHARAERERVAARAGEGDEAYWREHLSGVSPILALPTDHPRPPAQSRRAGMCEARCSEVLSAKVRRFAAERGVPVDAVWLAAYAAVLHRYSGQDDVVIGIPYSSRGRVGADGLVGAFEDAIPVRLRLADGETFVGLLAVAVDALAAALAHGGCAFDRIVEVAQITREASHQPLCQAWFSMEDTPTAPPRMGTLATTVQPLFTGAFTGDVAFRVRAYGDTTRLQVEYSRDLFDEGTTVRLLGHLSTLLEAALEKPARSIRELPVLSREEETRILKEWNATAVEYPKESTVCRLFAKQVERTPQATALVFNDDQLTYAELDARAEAIAGRLRSAGVGPETLVALCAERSLEMVVGLLGILKAGAAYVPLDPAFPADRLAFMLEDSGAPVLVTQRRIEPRFEGKHVAVLLLDEAAPAGAKPAAAQPPARVLAPDNLAYVLYTSGSTGRPKGVMVTHRNVVNFFTGMDAVVGREPGAWLAVTSISFDISVLELFWTLTRGFKVVLLADQAGMKFAKTPGTGDEPSPAAVRSLDEQLARHGITHLQCTPSFARLLTRLPETLAALRPLRYMLVGGEGLPADLARTLVGALDGKLVNMYGPTETTVWSTSHVVKEARTGVVEIGRPIANTEIYLLDAHRQPVPAGVPGELYIGGDGVARGYWRRPELTAERFVEHPFGMPGRLYRTGDLARYRADGVIEFIGRADHQVKVRGHRIELGEIEAVLARHPAVAQSVVVVRADDAEDPRLAAYLVPSGSSVPDAATFKRFVAEQLPAHMVPEFFVVLERLPLTPNGKIDRKALPAPTRPAPVAATSPKRMGTDGLEHAISAIWREILEVDQLDADDNFFDAGGRSLHVVEVKNRLHESLGVEVPVIRLFQYPTIRSLAGFIDAQLHTTVASKP